jgi:endonuclease/exonuclease/phosphatase family metal-dependent hydrolase
MEAADTTPVQIRAMTWNVFHGRDFPPDPSLLTWRSRLLRITERDATHVQVNRDLYARFERLIAGAEWDVLLLQEFPPRWADRLAAHCGADHHRVLTSRNQLHRVSAVIADLTPDLIASNEGGSNMTMTRGDRIVERHELVLHDGRPERRTMALSRIESGLCVANLHASQVQPLPQEELPRAARVAAEWAGDGTPVIFGGDFNLRPKRAPEVFVALERDFDLCCPTADDAIDHLLARGLTAVEVPRPWPPEQRELEWDGLRLRLSDHTPVEAVFELD